MDVVAAIERKGSQSGKPAVPIEIEDCGMMEFMFK
jgi:hypothetical protein